MSKILTIALGGEERTLDVGKFWFTEYYGEVTGNDPLNMTDIILKPQSQFAFMVNMVFAGMRCHAKVNKLAFDITRDQVEDWVGNMEVEEVSKVIMDYMAITAPTDVDATEQKKTENASPGNG